MGYITDFSGQFNLDKPLDDETYTLLKGLNETRRMKRNVDPKYGVEGEFYVESDAPSGQDFDNPNVIDGNTPPSTQPGLWCQWTPTEDRLHIEWDEGEKFYYYVEWIKYIVDKILKPRGYVLNGEVEWEGESTDDLGLLSIKDNVVTTKLGRIVYD